MPADANLVFTQNVVLSNNSTMVDGVPLNFTTPSVNIGAVGIPLGTPLVARFFIPAFTGSFTRSFLTLVVQGNPGAPGTAGLWVDVANMFSVPGRGTPIRPHMTGSSDGSGSGFNNRLFSNVALARFVAPFTNYRLSGQYLASNPNYSMVAGTLRAGHGAGDYELY